MTSLAIPPGVDLTKVPLAANPSGAPPNFVDSPSLAAVTYGMTCTMMVLAYSLVALRCVSVFKKERRLKIDDCELRILGLGENEQKLMSTFVDCCILALGLTSAYGILIMLSKSFLSSSSKSSLEQGLRC